MKLKTEIIALADYASISQENKLSINGIFDELRLTKFPGGIPRAFLVATIHGEPAQSYKLSIRCEDIRTSKNVLNPLDMEVFISPSGKSNIIAELVNMGFEKEGSYRFVIYNGKEEVGSTQLKVFYVGQHGQQFSKPN